MLNRLPTIGRRLGPGGYGKRFLREYHTNRVQLNKTDKIPRGNKSDRVRVDMVSVKRRITGTVALEEKRSLRCVRVNFYDHE
jgi:hypothetical protein